jgi:hypothetical protein
VGEYISISRPRPTRVVDNILYRASRGVNINAIETKSKSRRASDNEVGTLAEAHESRRLEVTTHDYRKLQTDHQHVKQLPLPLP